MTPDCTDDYHASLRITGYLLNIRPWPGLGLSIGECAVCKSSLTIPSISADSHIAVVTPI